MIATICASLADAFMSIGVFVLALAVAAALLYRRFGAAIATHLVRHRRSGPVIGALLALPPGCLGVLTVSRLYRRDHVTYGTLLACFVATMGDSAWLLLASDPGLTLALKVLMSFLGLAAGYAADAVSAHPRMRSVVGLGARTVQHGRPAEKTLAVLGVSPDHEAPALLRHPAVQHPDPALVTAGQDVCAPTDGNEVGAHPFSAAHALVLVGVAGLMLSTGVTFHLVSAEDLATIFGGVDVYLVTGLIGFAAAVWVVAQAPLRGRCCPTADVTESAFEQLALAGARDAARITVWGGLAFAVWEVGSELGWTSVDTSTLWAPIGIVVIALIGLVPACGVEVAVAGLFVAGGLPLPGLVTYLISQDGSGLIPLAVSRPRAALSTSVITTVLAVAIGWIMIIVS